MTAQEAYILAKAYTKKSIEGAGSLKGSACQIKSIEEITGGHRITFEWENNDGEVSTDTMDVMDGADGNDGVGISSITYKETDAHGNYVYTVTLTDTNTYDIICPKGAQGETGATGATGNGIASIVKTSTAGLVDTYTITYTNGQTTTFTVTNGESITVDSAMSDSSTNPVQNKVITEALALKQDVTDNSLDTEEKTIVGAINEHEGDIDSLKSGFTALDNEVNGDATTYPYVDVITINDAVPANLADCSVKVEPVQDLHGYDKPWVGGAGKNKAVTVLETIKSSNTGGTWNGNTYTFRGISFEVKMDSDGNITSIVVNGTSSDDWATLYLGGTTLPAGSYILSGSNGGSSSTWRITYGNGNIVSYDGDKSFTLSDTTTNNVSIIVRTSGTTVNNVAFYPMIRLSTETDSTFAPYTNICPISGHTETVVTREGKNLAFKKITGYTINASGVIEAQALYNLFVGRVKKGQTYTVTKSSDYKVYAFYTTEPSSGSASYDGSRVAETEELDYYTIVAPIDGYIAFRTNTDFNNGQLEVGSTATPYEPYAGQQYTLALGDTIYGGKVRIDSKGNTVMDVDRAIVDLGTLNWAKSSLSGHERYYVGLSSALTAGNIISDCFDYCDYDDLYNHVRDNVISINTGSASVEVYSTYYLADYDATQFKTAMDGHYACYELATPLTVQLTPEQIQLLQGTNTLYASTGDISVSVNGVSGSIGAVQEQVNDIAEDVADIEDDVTELQSGQENHHINIGLQNLITLTNDAPAGTYISEARLRWDDRFCEIILAFANSNGFTTGEANAIASIDWTSIGISFTGVNTYIGTANTNVAYAEWGDGSKFSFWRLNSDSDTNNVVMRVSDSTIKVVRLCAVFKLSW